MAFEKFGGPPPLSSHLFCALRSSLGRGGLGLKARATESNAGILVFTHVNVSTNTRNSLFYFAMQANFVRLNNNGNGNECLDCHWRFPPPSFRAPWGPRHTEGSPGPRHKTRLKHSKQRKLYLKFGSIRMFRLSSEGLSAFFLLLVPPGVLATPRATQRATQDRSRTFYIHRKTSHWKKGRW